MQKVAKCLLMVNSVYPMDCLLGLTQGHGHYPGSRRNYGS